MACALIVQHVSGPSLRSDDRACARIMHRPSSMASRRKVLIVEDDADLRRLYAIGLNQKGFEVKLAANGAEALDRIRTEKPHVMLLDMAMPIMDGWEVLEKFATLHPPRHIPVVVISGQPPSPERPAHPLIVSWLSKPIALEELAQAVRKALPASGRRRGAISTLQ